MEKAENRFRILSYMTRMVVGDILITPNIIRSGVAEIAEVVGAYRFEMPVNSDGTLGTDFGHIIEIQHLGPIERDVNGLKSSFSFLKAQEAIKPILNRRNIGIVDDVLAKLRFTPAEDQSIQSSDLAGLGSDRPQRISGQLSRYDRDSRLVSEMKLLYGWQCQICQTYIRTASPTKFYIEVHHLESLGGTELKGADRHGNMMVVCPNCHVRMQLGITAIHPETLEVHELFPVGKPTPIMRRHDIDKGVLERLWKEFTLHQKNLVA